MCVHTDKYAKMQCAIGSLKIVQKLSVQPFHECHIGNKAVGTNNDVSMLAHISIH